MSEAWIPIISIVAGCAFVVAMVVVRTSQKVQETRMRVEAEIQQMETAYQRARESFSR